MPVPVPLAGVNPPAPLTERAPFTGFWSSNTM